MSLLEVFHLKRVSYEENGEYGHEFGPSLGHFATKYLAEKILLEELDAVRSLYSDDKTYRFWVERDASDDTDRTVAKFSHHLAASRVDVIEWTIDRIQVIGSALDVLAAQA